MGQSTDGILFYGIAWNEEINLLGDEEEGGISDYDWWKKFAFERGIVDPFAEDSYPSDAEIQQWAERHYVGELPASDWQRRNALEAFYLDARRFAMADQYEAWSQAEKDIKAEFGCDIGHHCSSDCSMPYIYIPEAHWENSRGYPKQIEPADIVSALGEQFAWNARLTRFVEALGVGLEAPEWGEAPRGPGFFLVSYWG